METSSANKSVALKAGLWYVISTIVIKAISIITTPLFTRLLTTEQYGIVSTFTSWYSLLFPIFSLNLTYGVARAKIDFSEDLDKYIGSMQILSLFFSVFISIPLLFFIEPVSNFMGMNSFAVLLLILYLVLSPVITFTQCGYRYKYKYKQNILISFYISLTTVVLSLFLVLFVDFDEALLRIIGIVVPALVLSVFLWFFSFKKKQICINPKYWRYGLKISGPLILHTISLYILAQSDRIFVNMFCGNEATGIYSLAYNYAMLLSIITTAINEGWAPWFHDSLANGKKTDIRQNTKKIVVLSCFVSLGCIALGPEALFVLGGNNYSDGVLCVPPIVLGVLCQYIYSHYINIELHLKNTMFSSIGTVIAAGLNILLNILFVPIFGYVAAAYTTLICYIVLMLMHFIISRLILHVKLYSDLFMFMSLLFTSAVAFGILYSYNFLYLRIIIICFGFISFLIYFRRYIVYYFRKIRAKFSPKNIDNRQ